jgi:uncharacterized protein (DUF736 family)
MAAKQQTKAPKGKQQSSGGSGGYDDTNRGVLFVNDKGDNENRPDFTGNLAINPDEYAVGDDGLIRIRLAAWNKNSQKVGDYLSISASAPQEVTHTTWHRLSARNTGRQFLGGWGPTGATLEDHAAEHQ